MIPESPPITKKAMKPPMKRSGALKTGVPETTVSVQAKIWIVDGITTVIEAAAKKIERGRRESGREHVVGPDAEADEGDEQLGERDEREGDHPPPRERRDDRGRDPERRQDDDVDLGVPEDPEEVLPEERQAAVRDVEEVEAELALQLEEDQIDRQRREGEEERERGREVREAEERHPVERHPGRAELEDRDDEVDRRHRRGDAVEDQPERVEVDARARVVLPERERHVVEPARRSARCPVRARRRSGSRSRAKSQNESAFSRGNAMSRAPIISGTR